MFALSDKKTDAELDKAFWDSKPVSASDCTGLIQGLPLEKDVVEAYANMYEIPKQGGLNERMNPDGSIRGSSNPSNKRNPK